MSAEYYNEIDEKLFAKTLEFLENRFFWDKVSPHRLISSEKIDKEVQKLRNHLNEQLQLKRSSEGQESDAKKPKETDSDKDQPQRSPATTTSAGAAAAEQLQTTTSQQEP